jgi:hypothetical protein
MMAAMSSVAATISWYHLQQGRKGPKQQQHAQVSGGCTATAAGLHALLVRMKLIASCSGAECLNGVAAACLET